MAYLHCHLHLVFGNFLHDAGLASVRLQGDAMNRPIVWAFGILVSTVVSVVSLAPRLAAFADRSGSDARPATPTVKSAVPAGPRQFSISADYRGHFTVHPMVRNTRLRMLVDTGASLVALTDSDARSLGLKLTPADYRIRISTANGVITAASVHLDELTLGEITVRRVEAVVMPAGALETSLLGMSFLRRLATFEITSGRLVLKG
jgi:aspartyl protease family protein